MSPNSLVFIKKKLPKGWQSPNLSQSEILFLIFIFVSGAIWRLYFARSPIGWDEAVIYGWTKNWSWLKIFVDYSNIGNHIFHTFLTKASVSVFGTSLWALRLPVIVLGIIFPLLSYPILKRIVGSYAAMITLVLVSLSPWQIYWSTSARGYFIQSGLVFLWFCLTLIAIKEDRFSFKQKVLWLILCVLSFYTLPTTLWVVPGFFVGSFFYIQRFHLPWFHRIKNLFFLFSIAAPVVMILYGMTMMSNAGRAEVGTFWEWGGSPISWLIVNLRTYYSFFWELPENGFHLLATLCFLSFLWGLYKKDPFSWLILMTVIFASLFALFTKRLPGRIYMFLAIFFLTNLGTALSHFSSVAIQKFRLSIPLKSFQSFIFIGLSGFLIVDSFQVRNRPRLFNDYIASDRAVMETIQSTLKLENDRMVGIYPQMRYWGDHLGYDWDKYNDFPQKKQDFADIKRIFFIARTFREGPEIGQLRVEREVRSALKERILTEKPILFKSFPGTDLYYYELNHKE